jgi:hypothetical protein
VSEQWRDAAGGPARQPIDPSWPEADGQAEPVRPKRARWFDRRLVQTIMMGMLLIAAPPVALAVFGSDAPSAQPPATPSTTPPPGGAPGVQASSRLPGSSVSLDSTGRLVVVTRGSGDRVQRNFQSRQAGPLTGWSVTDVRTKGRPIVARNAQGGLTMFAIGPDGRLRRSPHGASNAVNPPEWQDMGGSQLTGTPAAAQDSRGRTVVVVRDDRGDLWVSYQDDSGRWAAWAKLPGPAVRDDPAIYLDRGNRLRIFALGDGGQLRTEMEADPAGTNWISGVVPGNSAATSPAVAIDHRGRLVLFVVGTDGTLRHDVELGAPGSWRGWRSEGGRLRSRPIAAADAEGTVVAFAVNADNGQLLLIRQSGEQKLDWKSWFVLGGAVSEPVAAARDVEGRLVVFAIGTGGRVLENTQDSPVSNGWSDWQAVD